VQVTQCSGSLFTADNRFLRIAGCIVADFRASAGGAISPVPAVVTVLLVTTALAIRTIVAIMTGCQVAHNPQHRHPTSPDESDHQ
jgi:hypothetical protein